MTGVLHFTGSILLQGFAERKILLLCDAVQACRNLHSDEAKRERQRTVKAYCLVSSGLW